MINNFNGLTQKCYLVGNHPYSFQNGRPSEVIGVKWVKPEKYDWRLAYEVEYFDGKKDFVPVSEVQCGNYLIYNDIDLANKKTLKS